MSITFKLKPQYAGFGGGVISVGPYSTPYDVGAALTAGGGQIVATDQDIIDGLMRYEPLYVYATDSYPIQPSFPLRLRSLSVGTGMATTSIVFEVHRDNELYPRLQITGDGTMRTGNGLAAPTTGSSSSSSSSTGAATSVGSSLLRTMANDDRDVQMTIIGDSTSAYSSSSDLYKWPYLLGNYLNTLFPKYTVKHSAWTGSFYQDQGTLVSGSGTHSLRIYNASWGGQGTRFHQATNPSSRLYVYDQPAGQGTGGVDLVFISHGHNDGTGAAQASWRDELLGLTESLGLFVPGTEIVLIAQNPRVGIGDYQEALQHETARVARMRGYGFINVWQAFVSASPGGVPILDPNPGAIMNSDGIHPNAAGQQIWANAITARLAISDGGTSQQPSSLSQAISPAANKLANADFSSFTTPPTLTSWTATNTTLSKNTTAGQFESPNGYSVKLTQVSSSSPSYMSQAVTNLKDVTGRYVILSARIFVPSSSSSTVGRISLVEGGGDQPGETISVASSNGQGGFIWVNVSRHISWDATSLTARVYGSANNEAAVMSVDRVTLTCGMLPRDLR